MRTRARVRTLAISVIAISLIATAAIITYGRLATSRGTSPSWIWQSTLPQGNQINGISFVSQDVGWAVGQSGVVLHTLNGGATWLFQNNGGPAGAAPTDGGVYRDWHGVSFVSTNTGWIVGTQGTIKRTTDGGASWSTATVSPAAGTLYGVAGLNSSTAVAVGAEGAVRYTSTGTSWSSGATTVTADLRSVAFPATGLAWAVGSGGTMLKSTDNGMTWVSMPSPTTQLLNSVAFAKGTSIGYAVGNTSGAALTALKTSDGTHWVALTPPASGVNLVGVACDSTGSHVVLVGTSGSVYRSDDGGVTWKTQNPGRTSSVTFRAAAAPSASRVNIGGDGGLLGYSRDAGAHWLSERQRQVNTIASVCTTQGVSYAVGSNGLLMKSTDGGTNWSGKSIAPGVALSGVAFYNANIGAAVGGGGLILTTADGGTTWTTATVSPASTNSFNAVAWFNSTTAVAVGNGGLVRVVTATGGPWTAPNNLNAIGTTNLYGVAFGASVDNVWAVGANGSVFNPNASGLTKTWKLQPSPTTATLRGVSAVDDNNVMIVGDAGTAFRSTNGFIANPTWTNMSALIGSPDPLLSVHATRATPTSPIYAWVSGAGAFVAYTSNGGLSWSAQLAGLPTLPQDIPTSVNSIWSVDGTSCVLVGTQGQIRTTSSRGFSWNYSLYGPTANLNRVSSVSSSEMWAVGADARVVNSFDGGQTWFTQDAGAAQPLLGIKMLSTTTGYAVGEAGTIRYTANGGWTQWTKQASGTSAALRSVDGTGTAAIAVGANGVILRTTNSGATTWTAASSVPTTQNVNDVWMTNAATAWAVASSGGPATSATILKTTDGGATWATQSSASPGFLAIAMRPGGARGWAVGAGGTIYATTNGSTWAPQVSHTSADLVGVSFSSDTSGTVTGAGGTILRTTDGGLTWTPDDSGTDSKSLASVAMWGSDAGVVVGEDGSVLTARDGRIPITTLIASPSAPDGDNGWYITQPSITLISNKGGTTYYRFNPPAGSYGSYTAPFTVPEGVTTLQYYSDDGYGAVEPTQSLALNVDTSRPTTPTTLAAGTPTASSVSLTWNASTDPGASASGISSYLVYVNGAFFQSSPTAGTTLLGLPYPNTQYTAYVVAVDVAGNLSAPSNTVTFTTTGNATDPLGTVLTLSPAAPNGANGWYVTAPVVSLARTPTTIAGQTYYSYDTTASGNLYSAAFGAQSGTHALWYWTTSAGRSTLYLETTLSVDPVVPNPPVSVVASATSESSIHLSWTAPIDTTYSGIDHYDVFAGGTYLASVTTPTTSFEVVGLSPTTSYSFQLWSVSSAGTTSSLTTTVTTTTLGSATLTPPQAVYARGTDGETVYIDWTPSPNAQVPTTYIVSRDDGAGFSAIATITSSTNPYQYSYVDTGRPAETAATYTVTVVDPRGTSAPSAPATAVTSVPLRPDALAATASTATPGSVLLSWAPSTDPTIVGYYVYRTRVSLSLIPTSGVAGPSDLATVAYVPAPQFVYIDSGLRTGLEYYYRVAAVDVQMHRGLLSLERIATPVGPAVDPFYNVHGDLAVPDDCAACHRSHTAPAPWGVLIADEATPTSFVPTDTVTEIRATWDNQSLCVNCHNGVRGLDVVTPMSDPLAAPPSGSLHGSVTSSTTVSGSLFCGSCHSSHRSLPPASNPYYLDVNGVTTGTAYCYQCHGTGTVLKGGDTTYFESSVHNAVSGNSPAGIKCDVCHQPVWATNSNLHWYDHYMQCVQCHSSEGDPAAPDILALLDSSADPSSRLPITKSDQQATGARVSCENCHNAMRVTSQYPLADPDAPFTSAWTGGQLDFCFKCHDGHYPTDAQTMPYVESPLGSGGTTLSVDIQSAYQTNVHGFAAATDGNANLRPEMGYSVGVNLLCTTCHDGHGTVNSFTLRQTVTSQDKTLSKTGLLVATLPGGGADFRFFCSACHYLPSHATNASFPSNCMGAGCHQHTMAPLGPGTTVTNTAF